MRERFRREAESAAQLVHPFICADRSTMAKLGDTVYLVMPYLAGGSLADLLVRGEDRGSAARGGRGVRAGGHCARLRASPRRRASRHQARQHPVRRGRPTRVITDFGIATARFHGRLTAIGPCHGDAALHVARAGDGQAGRRPERPLRGGRAALRDAARLPALRRRRFVLGRLQACSRGCRVPPSSWTRRCRWTWQHRHEVSRQERRRALRARLRARRCAQSRSSIAAASPGDMRAARARRASPASLLSDSRPDEADVTKLVTVRTRTPFIIARGGASEWQLGVGSLRDAQTPTTAPTGWGEAAPSRFYGEYAPTACMAAARPLCAAARTRRCLVARRHRARTRTRCCASTRRRSAR